MDRGKAPLAASTPEDIMTPEDALEVGIRFGSVYTVAAVSIDANPSSPVIRDALIAGLTAAGADVIYGGTAPVPAVCFAYARDAELIACVGSPDAFYMPSVTFYHPDGSRFTRDEVEMVLGNGSPMLPENADVGNVMIREDANGIYINGIRNAGLQADGFVILDCGCGSTSLVAPRALSEAGADISTINSYVGRRASRNPGINKSELLPLGGFVNESVGSIGIAYNGDGTRLAVMDEAGKYITGDRTLALMLMYMEPRVAVIPFDSPEIVEDAFWHPLGLRERGSGSDPDRRIVRAKNDIDDIVKAVRDNDADIGALNDGTFIFPDIGLCPDAIYASAIISELAGARSLRNVLGELPAYSSREIRVKYDGNLKAFGKKLLQKMVEYDITEIYVGGGAWKVVMKRGEYIIAPDGPDFLKVRAESSDPMYLVSMLEQARSIVEHCAGR